MYAICRRTLQTIVVDDSKIVYDSESVRTDKHQV